MRRWTEWDWRGSPDATLAWPDPATRLITMDELVPHPLRYRASEAMQRAVDGGAVAVVRCTAEQLHERPTWLRSIIPALVARTQAELDAGIAALVGVNAACRALWLKPTGKVEIGPDLEATCPVARMSCRACCGTGVVSTGSVDVNQYEISRTCGVCHGACGADWIIVAGGEEPLHPAHVRALRDECAALDVPFSFRSWGSWVPIDQRPLSTTSDHLDRMMIYGTTVWWRVGTARSGALLDGVEHDDRPVGAR
jgi:hypothetical protein